MAAITFQIESGKVQDVFIIADSDIEEDQAREAFERALHGAFCFWLTEMLVHGSAPGTSLLH